MSNILRVSVAALLLASCAGSAPPLPTGDWHALNAGRWEFGGNAVTAPPVAASQLNLDRTSLGSDLTAVVRQ